MASLENVAIKDSYTSLLKLNGNTDTLVAGASGDAIQVVDGNGDASPLYLNTDRLGIGGQPTNALSVNGAVDISGGTTITTVDNTDTLTLVSTDADNNAGAYLNIYRNSASPADNDQLGQITFTGRNDNSQDVDYARIITQIRDASDGSELGRLAINTMIAGGVYSRINIMPTETVFNDESADLDFRIESDADTHAFFLEGSTGNIGVGTAPAVKMHLFSGTHGANLLTQYTAENDSGTAKSVYTNLDPDDDSYRLYMASGGTGVKIKSDGVYIGSDGDEYVHSQNVPNITANSMSSPYYRFDGTDDVITVTEATQTPHLELGTSDFSFEMLVRAEEWTSLTYLFGKFEDGNNYYAMYTDSNDYLNFYAIDGGSGKINLVATATGGLTNGQWAHIAVVADRSGSGQFYVNGTAIGTTTSTMSTDAVEQNANFTIARLDTNYGKMEMSNLRYFNKALTATEVKELYSGASVPFKYKGANQTASYTSDFTSGADSWANAGRATVTGNSDSVGGVNDTLKIIADATTGASHYARRDSATATRRAYRIKFDYYIPSGQTVDGFQFGLQTTLNQFSATGSWQTNVSFEVNDLSSGDLFLYLSDGGSQTVTGDAENEYVALKNITVVPIGAVAEYDGSGAGEKVWGDKSGNDLHGTVSGATLENTPYDSGTEYEEGSFTPTISSGITSVGYHTQAGFYTKIGNLVNVNLYIRVSSGTSNTSSLVLDGLPYNNVNTAEKIGGFYVVYSANLDDDNSTPPRFQTKINTSDIEVYKMDGNRFLGSNTDYAEGATVSFLEIRLAGSYYTS